MSSTFSIVDLRNELGLSLRDFALRVGISSGGNMSMIERGGPCSPQVALAIERLSVDPVTGVPRIDAGDLNPVVRAARAPVASVEAA